MKAPAFRLRAPKDVASALKLLAEGGSGGAGTQSLGPMLNLRVAHPTLLVDSGNRGSLTFRKAKAPSPRCLHHHARSKTASSRSDRRDDGLVAASFAYRAVRTGPRSAAASPTPTRRPTGALTASDACLVGVPKGKARETPVVSFATGIFTTVLAADELIVGAAHPEALTACALRLLEVLPQGGRSSPRDRRVLHDPETSESRAVVGAWPGPPGLVDEKTFDGRGHRRRRLFARLHCGRAQAGIRPDPIGFFMLRLLLLTAFLLSLPPVSKAQSWPQKAGARDRAVRARRRRPT
jgi:carbon-monoxide dehydrogenase medium subunit